MKVFAGLKPTAALLMLSLRRLGCEPGCFLSRDLLRELWDRDPGSFRRNGLVAAAASVVTKPPTGVSFTRCPLSSRDGCVDFRRDPDPACATSTAGVKTVEAIALSSGSAAFGIVRLFFFSGFCSDTLALPPPCACFRRVLKNVFMATRRVGG